MRAGVVIFGLLSLSACKASHDDSPYATEQASYEPVAATPAPPTKDQIAAYNKNMIAKAMAMAKCRLAKPLVLEAMQSNNQYEMYQKAQEGEDVCSNVKVVINGFDFTYLQNESLAKKIKTGLDVCADSALDMQLAFDTIAKVANSEAPARPSDVDEIQFGFSKAEESWKDCNDKLHKIDKEAGLAP